VVGPAVGNVEHPPSVAPARLTRIAANFIVRHGFTIKTHFLSQRAEKHEVAKYAAHVVRWIIADVKSWRVSVWARRLAAALGFRSYLDDL